MQPEVSKRIDQLVEQFKKTVTGNAEFQNIDAASLTIRVKFKLKHQEVHGIAPLAAAASICLDCSDPILGCVKC
jgi:hypothetical protein